MMAFDERFPDFDDIDLEEPAGQKRQGGPNGQAHDQSDLVLIDWPSREGRTPPAREFVVDGWLPTGCATSLYAPGGFGKSLIGQLLASCVASGRPFLGLTTMHAPTLGIFCEDDDDELWRRQGRINEAFSLRMTDLGAFAAQGRLGMPNVLMTFAKGKQPADLPLLAAIEAKAREVGAKLIVLDNAAQLFGGEENARAEVTAFVNALNGVARRLNAAVLMLGHPPKSGAEYSGSTAWHSVVRCMWTLARAAEKEDDDDEVSELMVLTRSKANYAIGGEELHLRWVGGVLRRDDGDEPLSGIDAAYRRHNAKGAFLAALDELTGQRRSVSHSDRAGNFAPNAFKAAGLAPDYSKADLRRAMNALFADHAITANAKLWRQADRKFARGIARLAPGAEPDP